MCSMKRVAHSDKPTKKYHHGHLFSLFYPIVLCYGTFTWFSLSLVSFHATAAGSYFKQASSDEPTVCYLPKQNE